MPSSRKMRSATLFASQRSSKYRPLQLTRKQSAALLQAIKDYENNKWKVIGQKVGKPAKVCLLILSFAMPWTTDLSYVGLRTVCKRTGLESLMVSEHALGIGAYSMWYYCILLLSEEIPTCVGDALSLNWRFRVSALGIDGMRPCEALGAFEVQEHLEVGCRTRKGGCL